MTLILLVFFINKPKYSISYTICYYCKKQFYSISCVIFYDKYFRANNNKYILTCTGQTAFDYIIDYDEWIECGYFDDEIKARLKGKWNQRAPPPLLHTQINSLKKFSIFKLHLMWNVCLHLVLYWKYFIFYSIQSEAL